MKTRLPLMFSLFFFSFAVNAEILDSGILKSRIESSYGELDQVQLTYQVQEYYFVNMSESSREEFKEEIDHYRQILELRKADGLTEEQQEKWKKISDDDLNAMITQREDVLRGEPQEAIYVFTRKDIRMRQDIIRPTGNPMEHYYVHDGLNGFMVKPESKSVMTGDAMANRWEYLLTFPQFGSGLDFLFDNSYIMTMKDENSVLTLAAMNDGMQRLNRKAVFKLMPSNPQYWTECDLFQNDTLLKRFVCDDFETHEGLLVPKTVREQKIGSSLFRMGKTGGRCPPNPPGIYRFPANSETIG